MHSVILLRFLYVLTGAQIRADAAEEKLREAASQLAAAEEREAELRSSLLDSDKHAGPGSSGTGKELLRPRSSCSCCRAAMRTSLPNLKRPATDAPLCRYCLASLQIHAARALRFSCRYKARLVTCLWPEACTMLTFPAGTAAAASKVYAHCENFSPASTEFAAAHRRRHASRLSAYEAGGAPAARDKRRRCFLCFCANGWS